MRLLIFSAIIAASSLLFVSCSQEPVKQMSPSGYEYILHEDKEGETPVPGEYAYFHAQIRKADSIVYRTREESAQVPFMQIAPPDAPDRPPSPLEDVLSLMSVGDSATVFIPIDSVPPQSRRGFEDADEIIYDMVMTDIKSAEAFQAEQEQMRQEAQAAAAEVKEKVDQLYAQYQAGELDDQIQETGSGLRYLILEAGTGPQAAPGKLAVVDYYGILAESGQEFDNSYKRGQALPVPVGQGRVIPGWDEGLALLKEGSQALFFIPSELGYGEAGSPPVIPGGAELIFYVELNEVQEMQ